MQKPVGLAFRSINNIRPVGTEITVFDYFSIPGIIGPGSVIFRLTELPLNAPLPSQYTGTFECVQVDPVTHVQLIGPITLTQIDQNGILTAGKFVVKHGTLDADDTFRFGFIRFSQGDAAKTYQIIYTGRGSLVMADDVLNLNNGLSLLPGVVLPGHISVDPTDSFYFPGDINISGNVNIAGEMNKTLSTTITTTDTFLRLNDAFATGVPVANAGLSVRRGSQPDSALTWSESPIGWALTGGPLLVPRIGISGGGPASGYVLTSDANGFARWAPTSGIGFIGRANFVSTSGQTDFVLPGGTTYALGTGSLEVYLNGLLVKANTVTYPTAGDNDYYELNTTTIRFSSGLAAGKMISMVVFGPGGAGGTAGGPSAKATSVPYLGSPTGTSRLAAFGTVFQNTGFSSIYVSVTVQCIGGGGFSAQTDLSNSFPGGAGDNVMFFGGVGSATYSGFFVVLPNEFYRVNTAGGGSILYWSEWQ